MPYSLDDKLVIAIASSALFDLGDADRVFREKGEEKYRQYQRDHENDVLEPGVAFPFIKRLLSYFDDQRIHLDAVAGIVPSVHVPFGIRNRQAEQPQEAV